MSFKQHLASDPRDGPVAAVALGAAVVVPITGLFIYTTTGMQLHWLMLAAVAGSAGLVAVGVRRASGR